jgi:transposase
MRADPFAGYNELYDAKRQPGPIYEAACWAHARRKFFELAKSAKAPIAIEAVRRIDELFEIERAINGKSPDERKAIRQERSKPLVVAYEAWLREQCALLVEKRNAKAINYSLDRWAAFIRFLDDGRIVPEPCHAYKNAPKPILHNQPSETFFGGKVTSPTSR